MRVGLTTQRPYSIELHPRQPVMLGPRCAIVGSRPGCRRASPRARQSPTPRICSAIETSMSSSLNIARRWDVARWLSIRHRRYGGDLRSNQKDGRQCTEHLRRDRRSAAAQDRSARRRAPDPHRPRARFSPGAGVMKLHLNLKARAVVLHVMAAGLILGFASLGTNWVFSRMVLGQFDQSLLELFKTEASSILADPAQSLHVHEMPARSGPPSFPRLDKFVQIIDLDGHVVSRSANLGSARLPASPVALARLRNGEEVLETLRDFGDEPVRMLSAPIVVRGQTYAIQIAGSLDDARAALRSARWLFLFSST